MRHERAFGREGDDDNEAELSPLDDFETAQGYHSICRTSYVAHHSAEATPANFGDDCELK